MEDDCLLRGTRVIVPPSLRGKVLDQLHDGHPGIVRMKSLARQYVWWPGLDADLEARVGRVSQEPTISTITPMGMAPEALGSGACGLCRTFLGAHVPCPDRFPFEVDGGAHDQFLCYSSNHCKDEEQPCNTGPS